MTPRTCPICSKHEPVAEYRPFCSRRCADLDLQKWFTGGYAIAAVEENEPGDTPPTGPIPDLDD
jgi:endogenous inhibitor of DNA gyrase (YacG/DUF329 family)